ncbi:MAG: holin family protein [Marinibacterium sp.]|nr:holin family protein [Marinibacterium sp.]
MSLFHMIFGGLFGGGRNVIAETAEVFRENAEAGAQRAHDYDAATLAQFAGEFGGADQGWFDSLVDGVNRLPRPLLALSVILLFASAMVDPVWFSARMQGLSLVPEPLWWLMGVIVSFYFGARHQAKAQQFQRSLAETMARVPQVVGNIETLRGLDHTSPGVADTGTDSALARAVAHGSEGQSNAALQVWAARAEGSKDV